MKRLIIISGLFLLSVCACLDLGLDKFGKVKIIPIRQGLDHAEAAAICRLASGEWLMLVSRPNSAAPGNTLLSLSTKDEGGTWSDADTAAVLPRTGLKIYVTQLPDGVVTVLYGLYRSRLYESVLPLGSYLIRSYDRGKTFSAPQPVISPDVDGILPSSAVFQDSEGLLAFLGESRKDGVVLPVVMVSDDLGTTWKSRPVAKPDSENRVRFGHPAPAILNDGKLICLLQREGSGYLYLTRTEDLGETWMAMDETPIFGKNPEILITRHNTVMGLYEDATPSGLSLRVSYDFGHSWEEEMPIVPLPFGRKTDIPYSVMETDDGIAILCIHAGAESDLTLAEVQIAPPPAPKGVSASVKGNAVSLRWNPLDHAAYYLVYRDKSPDFKPSRSGNPKSNLVGMPVLNRFIDAGVDSNQTVYYRVCGVRGSGPLIENTGSIGELSTAVRVEIP